MSNFKIGFFGDIMMGVCSDTRQSYENLLGVRVQKGNYNLDALNEFVNINDINIANLESPLSQEVHYQRGQKKILGPKEGIDLLKKLNINVVSLANNHTFDQGLQILSETKTILKDTGIISIRSPQFNDMSHTFEKKGKKICIIAYGAKPFYNVETDCLDPDYYKNWGFFRDSIRNNEDELNPDWLSTGNLAPLIKEVKMRKEEGSLVLVFIHWGFANTKLPSPIQIEIAHKLINTGANAVIGHHPHVIQPIEIYKGKPIAYSLGNFMFDSWKPDKKRSLLVRLTEKENSFLPEYFISDRDANYRFRFNPITMKEAEIKADEHTLQFLYPEFLETEIKNAKNILSSYYRYSQYRNRCRKPDIKKELVDFYDCDFSLSDKLSILFSKIK